MAFRDRRRVIPGDEEESMPRPTPTIPSWIRVVFVVIVATDAGVLGTAAGRLDRRQDARPDRIGQGQPSADDALQVLRDFGRNCWRFAGIIATNPVFPVFSGVSRRSANRHPTSFERWTQTVRRPCFTVAFPAGPLGPAPRCPPPSDTAGCFARWLLCVLGRGREAGRGTGRRARLNVRCKKRLGGVLKHYYRKVA